MTGLDPSLAPGSLQFETAGEVEISRELAASWSFAEVNELIERHNRNFPAEARLAMDPRTRDFVRVNGRPYARRPLDAQWILDRFPPHREAALGGVGSTEPPRSGGAGVYGAGAGNA